MKTETTSGNNRDTLGKNKINKKEDKPTGTTTMLHKDETNTTINQTNTPLENNVQNYPQLPQRQNKNKDTTTTTVNATTKQKDNTMEEITVIPETNPIPTTQQEETYDSPSLVTNHRNKLTQQTPEPNNISTPETPIDNEDNRKSVTPKTKKQLKGEFKIYTAKKFTTQIQQTNFWDIGRLIKATKQEKNTVIPLSMYDRLGPYDPSNEYIANYKHKDVLQKYKEISKDRPTKNNNLIELYDIMKNIELRG